MPQIYHSYEKKTTETARIDADITKWYFSTGYCCLRWALVRSLREENMKKRILSALLCVCMTLNLLSLPAWAITPPQSDGQSNLILGAVFGGDITSTGLNVSGKNEMGNIDPSYDLPSEKTIYKAGDGYVLLTPKTDTSPAVLELMDAQITTSSPIIILPETEAFKMVIEGDVDLTVTGNKSVILTNGQPLSIVGEGNLSLTGGDIGILVNGMGSISINLQGDMTFQTRLQPIFTSGDVTIVARSLTTIDSGYFQGRIIDLAAREGDISLGAKGSLYGGAFGFNGLTLRADKGSITVTNDKDGSYALRGLYVDISSRDDIKIVSDRGGIMSTSGHVSMVSEAGSIEIDAQGSECIFALGSLITLSAMKDIVLETSQHNFAAGISASTAEITANGKFSSFSDYGLQVSELNIKAREVYVEGFTQDAISSNNVIITNTDGEPCDKVTLIATSQFINRAALNVRVNATIKADDLIIRGNNQAIAVIVYNNATLGNSGMIMGDVDIRGTADISSDVIIANNGGNISEVGLNLSTPPTEKTIYLAGNGYALYQPEAEGVAASLTLNGVDIEGYADNDLMNLGTISTLRLEGSNRIRNVNTGVSSAMATQGNEILVIEGTSEDTLEVHGVLGMLLEGLTVSGPYVSTYGEITALSVVGDLGMKGAGQLVIIGESRVIGDVFITEGSSVSLETSTMYARNNMTLSGLGSVLDIKSSARLHIDSLPIAMNGARVQNEGTICLYLETSTDDIKALKVAGNGLIKVSADLDGEGEGSSSWYTYLNDGTPVFEIEGELDLNQGDHSLKTLETDGYTFENGILTLGDYTYIQGNLTLPDNIMIQGSEHSIIQGSLNFKGDYPCNLVVSGAGLSVLGHISNGQGGSMTVSEGATVTVHGMISIGTSGGADGQLTVSGEGTTLTVTSQLGTAILFETVLIDNGARVVASASGDGSIGLKALSGGVSILGGSSLVTNCDYGVYISDGKLTVDGDSKLVTKGAVAPFCIIDTTATKNQEDILSLPAIPIGTAAALATGLEDFYGVNRHYWSLVYAGGHLSVSNEHSEPVALSGAISGAMLEFYAPNYTVTVLNDGNGTASASPTSAKEGSLISLTATPNNTFLFKEWQVVEGTLSITNNTFIMPSENVTLRAIFVAQASDNPQNSGSEPASAQSQSTLDGVEDGILKVYITEKMVKEGTIADGILRVKATSKASYHSVIIYLEAAALDAIKASNVYALKVETDIIDIGFDALALGEIHQETAGTVSIWAMHQKGNRPAFDITMRYQKSGTTQYLTQLKKGMMTVGIHYDAAIGEELNRLVCLDLSSKDISKVISHSVYAKGKVFFRTQKMSHFGVDEVKMAFMYRDIEKHWAEDKIQFNAVRELLKDSDEGVFSPNVAVTRETFLTALGMLANVDVSVYKASSFIDVEDTAASMPYIEWAVANHIVVGIGNDQFGPNQWISRQDMAVMMANFAKATSYRLYERSAFVLFADEVSISAYAKEAVASIQKSGIMMGKDGLLFDPKGTATRAEAAAIIKNFIELIAE